MRVAPATTESGLSDFVIDRSADAVTVVSSLSVFGVVGSAVVAVTDALLDIKPPSAGAVTVIVIVGAAPTASEALVHVTTPADSLQVHPVPDAETYAVPAGSVSVTISDVAVLGPAFETARV